MITPNCSATIEEEESENLHFSNTYRASKKYGRSYLFTKHSSYEQDDLQDGPNLLVFVNYLHYLLKTT